MDIAYLDRGLIPNGDPLLLLIGRMSEGDTLKNRLEGMSPSESKIARRKFRKYFRRAANQYIEFLRHNGKLRRIHLSKRKRDDLIESDIDRFKRSIGIDLNEHDSLSNKQSERRRALVRSYIYQNVTGTTLI
jgi:hypothetical protein